MAVQVLFFITLVLALGQALAVLDDIVFYPRGAPEEVARLIVSLGVAVGLRSWAVWIESTGHDESS